LVTPCAIAPKAHSAGGHFGLHTCPRPASPTRTRGSFENATRQLSDALAEAKGSDTEAAKLLGVHPNYLHRLIRNLEMKAELREQEDEQ